MIAGCEDDKSAGGKNGAGEDGEDARMTGQQDGEDGRMAERESQGGGG